jgi:ferric-dicitrate binding protein FerR (iron transport regulator)
MVHVMSEVQRYLVDPIRLGNPSTSRAVCVVSASEFDAAQENNVQLSEAHRVAQKQLGDLWKELDAQRLRADTAEAGLEVLRREVECRISNEVNAVEALAVAEQRIAVLTIALKTIFGMLQHKATTPLELESTLMAHAALNPNPEAESNE